MEQYRPDDRVLRYALAVAEAGSIRGAARELDVAPSAVQRALTAAERRLGASLFERGADGARMTATGEILVRGARERRDLEARMSAELDQVVRGVVGEARIAIGLGFVDDIGDQVLGPMLADLPGVRQLHLVGGTDAMTAALARDEADVAVVLHARPHPGLRIVRSAPQPLGLAVGEGHELAARREPLLPAQLDGRPCAVMPPGFGLRALYDEFLRVYGITMPIRVESPAQRGLLAAIRPGELSALLPPVFVGSKGRADGVRLLPVRDEHLASVRAVLLTRAGRRLPTAATELLERCAHWFDTSFSGTGPVRHLPRCCPQGNAGVPQRCLVAGSDAP